MLAKLLNLRFTKFIIIGVLSTLTHALFFVMFIEILGIAPVVSSIPSFSLAVIVSYTGNYVWTFESDSRHIVQFPKFISVAIIGLLANILITYTIVDILGAWYGLALATVIILVPLMTYQLNRLWVFNRESQL